MTTERDQLIYDEEYWPPPSHPLRLALALLLLAGGAVVATVWFVGTAGLAGGSSNGADTTIEVPAVEGMSSAQATARLEELGFVAEMFPERNVMVPVGEVFDQDPKEGLLGSPGDVVQLRVSAGDEFVLVPDLSGSLEDRLAETLFWYGLQLGEVTYQQDRTTLEGEVLAQTPAPGAEVDVGSVIDVVVSEGPPPVEVPSVVGLDALEATQILGQAGFQVTERRVYSRTRFGHVVSTNPRPGAQAPYGTVVQLNVSRGPAPAPPPTRPPTTSPTPSPTTPGPTTPSPPSTAPPTTSPPSNGGGGGDGGGGGSGNGGGGGGGDADSTSGAGMPGIGDADE